MRLLLGYARYDQLELVERVYDLDRNEWRLLQNFFQPIMKLKKKERRGASRRESVPPAFAVGFGEARRVGRLQQREETDMPFLNTP